MKLKFIVGGLLCVAASLAHAKDVQLSQKGSLTEMEAVACGTQEKRGERGLKAVMLGDDSSQKNAHPLLCQEYVLQSDSMEYRIRVKDEKHAVLLPVGDSAEFQLKKDYMLLRAPQVDNKIREYFVMSMKPRSHKEQQKTMTKTGQ